jgi:hypothetical protein
MARLPLLKPSSPFRPDRAAVFITPLRARRRPPAASAGGPSIQLRGDPVSRAHRCPARKNGRPPDV